MQVGADWCRLFGLSACFGFLMREGFCNLHFKTPNAAHMSDPHDVQARRLAAAMLQMQAAQLGQVV